MGHKMGRTRLAVSCQELPSAVLRRVLLQLDTSEGLGRMRERHLDSEGSAPELLSLCAVHMWGLINPCRGGPFLCVTWPLSTVCQ